MTDEEKKVVEVDENCKCCKCCEVAKEFFLRAGAVFFGVLMALLVASALIGPKPGCPCKMMMNHSPKMERPFYPNGENMNRRDFKNFDRKGNHPARENFAREDRLPQDKNNR